MPPLQDIVNKATGGQDAPMSLAVQGSVQPPQAISTPAPTEPIMISSTEGQRAVQKAEERLNELAPAEPVNETGSLAIGRPEDTTTTPATPTETATTPDSITYVNPETGAETILTGDAITDSARKRLEKRGFQVLEENIANDPQLKAANLAQMKAQREIDESMRQLEQTAITDKELRQTVRTIRQRYSARMRQMEETNRRREQTLNTLGVRLGSRYTGGAGGVFGGILAEEERQGIERVTALEAEMLSAIEGAKKAAKEHNFTVFTKLVEKAEEKAKAKQEEFKKLQETQAEQDRLIKEEADLVANQSSIIEQIQAGMTSPSEIFAALGGTVPFDTIKEITDTLPETNTEQFTLGRYDIRYDGTGKVIARGSSAGGGGVAGETDISGVSSFGAPAVSVGAPIVQGIGTSYKNSTAEAQMLIDDILNKIPVQLRNTEVETELKKEQIRKQLAAGYSYQQIVDRLSGFSLQGDKADKPLGEALYNAALGTDIDLGQLASLINRGAGDQAMSLVENKQLENADGFFANTDKARGTVKQADDVLRILNDPTFPSEKLGAFDGRVFKVAKQVTPAEQVKIQQLESALSLLNSPIRVEIVGTAATASEMSKITGFQAEILDQPEIVKSKVQDLRDTVIRFHNEARSQRGLPQVDKEQLIDNKKRLQLYRELGGVNEEMVMSGMSNIDFLNSWIGLPPAIVNTDDNKSFYNQL